jgi:hypothetical protein
MTDEVVFFQKEGIIVTNARFVVGDTTYPIRNITSVRMQNIEPNKKGAMSRRVLKFGERGGSGAQHSALAAVGERRRNAPREGIAR